eukprot:CAMPEP_0170410768 /NCGR_PEP_ID=MMETSP0117_2-20130122/30067_1 /TAXON_ID=400756 /ORGANISM="Durinskia baltica, Strain CSIRO CS-38" /LENGTH=263 /DNA_ID=CAMNT_0010668325 /DNA_START=13 /DNA_END=805 /DNA_ORIENTATION=+
MMKQIAKVACCASVPGLSVKPSRAANERSAERCHIVAPLALEEPALCCNPQSAQRLHRDDRHALDLRRHAAGLGNIAVTLDALAPAAALGAVARGQRETAAVERQFDLLSEAEPLVKRGLPDAELALAVGGDDRTVVTWAEAKDAIGEVCAITALLSSGLSPKLHSINTPEPASAAVQSWHKTPATNMHPRGVRNGAAATGPCHLEIGRRIRLTRMCNVSGMMIGVDCQLGGDKAPTCCRGVCNLGVSSWRGVSGTAVEMKLL